MKKILLIILVLIILICVLINSDQIKLFFYQIQYANRVPQNTWAEVEVYCSDERIVVIAVNNTGRVTKAAVYSPERELISTAGIRIQTIDSVETYLCQSWTEIKHKLGQIHADTGYGFSYPSYFTRDGYLLSFGIKDNIIIQVLKYDLFTGELVEHYRST